MDFILEVRGLSKRFGDLWALRHLDFAIAPGEIVGLVGPNGAGKTTLFNLISGRLRPDSGEVFFAAENITGQQPHAICRRGIGRTFQSSRVFPNLTVMENVLVGLVYGKGWRLLARQQDCDDARELLAVVGLAHKEKTVAAALTLSERRRLDLARALATRPLLLLLDEVAAGFSPAAVKAAVQLIDRIRARGVTILVIDHFLNLSMRVSDRLLALDHGEKVAEGSVAEVLATDEVRRAYLGLRHERQDHELFEIE